VIKNEWFSLSLDTLLHFRFIKAHEKGISRLLKNRGKGVDMLDAVTIVFSCRANHRSIERVYGGLLSWPKNSL